jgi:hypothetical protein
MLIINMSIYFLDYGVGVLLCIWLLKCLVQVHDVTHHLSMERDWMTADVAEWLDRRFK